MPPTPPWTPTHQRAATVVARLATLPTGLRLGTSTAGYQVEGGYNGEGQPANNWLDWERRGRVARSGRGTDFWHRWPGDLDLAAQLGGNALRLGIEWARLERRPERPGGRVVLDEQALDEYARLLAGCRVRGLRPVVTLHHFTHPWHEGTGLWLDGARGLERFVPYAVAAVEALGERLLGVHHQAPLDYLITINEPFMYAAGTCLAGMLPGAEPSHRGLGAMARVLQTLHRLHVALYRALHRRYRERDWPRPTVTFNPWASAVFEADLQWLHLLLAPARGIPASRLEAHLAEQRARFESQVDQAVAPGRRRPRLRQGVTRAVRALARRALSVERAGQLLDDVYGGPPGERLLDVIGLDFYDPYFGDYLDLGGPRGLRLRRQPWDWRQVPEALPAFLRLYAAAGEGLGLGVELLEQGMALCGRGRGLASPHPEGYHRSALLRAGLLGCLEALADGVPVQGYFHWSLLDNYEWGSFEPRFGLHGVVYEEDARRLATDAGGEDCAAVYRAVARALATGDREGLVAALGGPPG